MAVEVPLHDRASRIINRAVIAFAALQFSPYYTRTACADEVQAASTAGNSSLNTLAMALVAEPAQLSRHGDLSRVVGDPIQCRELLLEFGRSIFDRAGDTAHREKVLSLVAQLAELHPKEMVHAQICLTISDGLISDTTYETVMESVAGAIGAKAISKEIVSFWNEDRRTGPENGSNTVLPSLITLLAAAVPKGQCILKEQILEIAPNLPPDFRKKFVVALTSHIPSRGNDLFAAQLSAVTKELLEHSETAPEALELVTFLLDSLEEPVGTTVLDAATQPDPGIALSLVPRVDRFTLSEYAARSPLKAVMLLPYIDRHILRAVQTHIARSGNEPARRQLLEYALTCPADTAYFGDFRLLAIAARSHPGRAKKVAESLVDARPDADLIEAEVRWLGERLIFPEDSQVRDKITCSYGQATFLIQCELAADEVFKRLFSDNSKLPQPEDVRNAFTVMNVFERHALAERIASDPQISRSLFAVSDLLSETAHGEEILMSVAKSVAVTITENFNGISFCTSNELSPARVVHNLDEIGRAHVLAMKLCGDWESDLACLEAETPHVTARCLLTLAKSVDDKADHPDINPRLSSKALGSLICAQADRIALSPAAYELFVLATLYADEDAVLQAMPAMRTNEGRIDIAVSVVTRLAQSGIDRAIESVPKIANKMCITDEAALYASIMSANRLLSQNFRSAADEQLRARIPEQSYYGALECFYRNNPDSAVTDAASLVSGDRGAEILLRAIRSPGQRVLDAKIVMELIRKSHDIDAARPLFQYLFLDVWEHQFGQNGDEDELLRREFSQEFAAYGIALRKGLEAEIHDLESNRRLAWEFEGLDASPHYRLMYHQDPAISLLPGVVRAWLRPVDAGSLKDLNPEQIFERIFERRLLIARELYRLGTRDFRNVTVDSVRAAETSLSANPELPLVFKDRNVLFLTNPEPAQAMFGFEAEFEVLGAERQMETTNRFSLPGNHAFFRSEGARSIQEIHPYESDVSPSVARDILLRRFVEAEPPFTFYAKLHGDPEALAPKGGHPSGIRGNFEIKAGLVTADALAKAYVERLLRYPQLTAAPDIMINDACQGFLFWENFWNRTCELCVAQGITPVAPILYTGAERGQLGYSSRGTKGGSTVFDALINIRGPHALDIRDLQRMQPTWGNPSLWIPAPDIKGHPRAGLRQISFKSGQKRGNA